MLHEVGRSSSFENQQKDHSDQYQMCKEPWRSPGVWEDCFLSWLGVTTNKISWWKEAHPNTQQLVLFLLMRITLVVEISSACFELQELHNLDVKRERTNAIFKYGFILPSNSWSSSGKICSMPVICSEWIQVCTQVWQS